MFPKIHSVFKEEIVNLRISLYSFGHALTIFFFFDKFENTFQNVMQLNYSVLYK